MHSKGPSTACRTLAGGPSEAETPSQLFLLVISLYRSAIMLTPSSCCWCHTALYNLDHLHVCCWDLSISNNAGCVSMYVFVYVCYVCVYVCVYVRCILGPMICNVEYCYYWLSDCNKFLAKRRLLSVWNCTYVWSYLWKRTELTVAILFPFNVLIRNEMEFESNMHIRGEESTGIQKAVSKNPTLARTHKTIHIICIIWITIVSSTN